MGSSVVETTGKKKLSGTVKGYLILFGLVVVSVVARHMTKSIYRLSDLSEKMSGLDFDVKYEAKQFRQRAKHGL